uniref:Uncharacterized protein n=1 Tax=viral metagenome TaxID=1070528 RepID=A0A6H1ZGZ3_9ZZZZ
MAEQFPENIQLGIAGTHIFPYAIVPGTYGFEDIDIFPEKMYEGAPRLDDYTGGPVTAQHDWSGGGGQLRFEDATRFWTSDADTRFEGRIGLGPVASQMYQYTKGQGATPSCFDAPISHFKEWEGNLYAFGAQYGYIMNKASPTLAWSRLAPPLTGSLRGTISDVKVYDNYVYLAVGSSARYYFSASLLHATISCTQAMSPVDAYAEKFEVLEGTFAKVASYVPGSRQYSDLKFSTTPLLEWTQSNRVGDTDQPINNLKIWNGLAWVFKPDGVYTFDSKGIAYDMLPEIENYRDKQLGKYACAHQNELYFNARESLYRFDGAEIKNIHPRQYIDPTKTRMPVEAWRGNFTGLLASDSWLWATGFYGPGSNYDNTISAYDNRKPIGQGWHCFNIGSAAAIEWGPTAAPYYSDVTGHPTIYLSGLRGGTPIIQSLRLPSGTNDPADDSNIRYSYVGYHYFSEMDLGLGDQEKAVLYVRAHTLNLTTGGYISVYYYLDGVGATRLSSITSSKIDSTGWITLPSTLTGKRIVWSVLFGPNDDGSSPYLDAFLVYWHVRPRRTREWNMQLLLAPNAVEGDTRGVGQMDEHLTTMRDRAGSIAFVNRLGSSYSVFLTKYSLKEVLKEGQQSPETVADVQLKQYITPS